MRWTCSCPAYLISWFLTCKHIICQINQHLDNKPLTDLEFLAKLHHQHSPPFFQIKGIHFIQSAPKTVVRAPCKVLRTLADINTYASEAASSEGTVEDTTGEHSPDSVTHASSPEYCNTSSLEEGSSSTVEEGEGSEGAGEEGSQVEEEHSDSRNVHGSAFTDTDSTNDSHISCCGSALHLPCWQVSDRYSLPQQRGNTWRGTGMWSPMFVMGPFIPNWQSASENASMNWIRSEALYTITRRAENLREHGRTVMISPCICHSK